MEACVGGPSADTRLETELGRTVVVAVAYHRNRVSEVDPLHTDSVVHLEESLLMLWHRDEAGAVVSSSAVELVAVDEYIHVPRIVMLCPSQHLAAASGDAARTPCFVRTYLERLHLTADRRLDFGRTAEVVVESPGAVGGGVDSSMPLGCVNEDDHPAAVYHFHCCHLRNNPSSRCLDGFPHLPFVSSSSSSMWQIQKRSQVDQQFASN